MPTYGTTDRFTGGTASADSVSGGYVAANACDDNNSTNWYPSAGTPNWWKYDFGASVAWAISKITIYSSTTGRINAFSVAGSNNDSSYTTLYSGNHANDTNLQTFTFTNRTKYRYIKITATSHHGTGTGITETQAFEGIYPSGGLGIGNPWVFLKDIWDKHKKLWTPEGLKLPKDLGFSY